ncbi:hypothetical protein CLIM01_14199 [Colletotrichum limetticola]|uniref:C2H2-type domain-containing protein n=1 Tax=Colletotrichum limetticola TaxID=1209924 RepID=A0ABQ9PDE3_9PEZI|nr:hypothetical protein CLIM01_14199 [Colletotrichum limetticola]
MRFFLLGVNVLNDEEEEETAQGATHTRLEAGPEATGRSDCRTGQLEEHESEGLSEPSSDAVSKATVEWQRTSPRGLLLLSRSGSALARSFISAEEQSLSARPKVSPTVFLSCTVVGCNQVFSDEREWAEHTRGRLCLPEEARSKYARGMRSEAAPRVVRSPSCPYPGCGARRREQEAPVFAVQAGVPSAGRPGEAPEGGEGDVQVLGETGRVVYRNWDSVAREGEDERSGVCETSLTLID